MQMLSKPELQPAVLLEMTDNIWFYNLPEVFYLNSYKTDDVIYIMSKNNFRCKAMIQHQKVNALRILRVTHGRLVHGTLAGVQ